MNWQTRTWASPRCATRPGLSARTLRYYEELGPAPRRAPPGRRTARLRRGRARAPALHHAPQGARPLARRDRGAERGLRDRRLDAARCSARLDELLDAPPRGPRRAHRRARRPARRDREATATTSRRASDSAPGREGARDDAPRAPRLAAVPRPARRVRVVTAASLFDGHDAAIHIMRRLLQAQGAEVIHLGHDRSVEEIVEAAAPGGRRTPSPSPPTRAATWSSSATCVERLRERGAGHVRVYGGGGGTIVPEEIAALEADGVARIFSPEDGRALGLEGMIRSHPRRVRRGARTRRSARSSRASRRASRSPSRAPSAGSRSTRPSGPRRPTRCARRLAARRARPRGAGGRLHRHRRRGQVERRRRAGAPLAPRSPGAARRPACSSIRRGAARAARCSATASA